MQRLASATESPSEPPGRTIMRLNSAFTPCVALCGFLSAVSPASAQQPEIRGSFVATDRRDITSIERFSITGDRLDGELLHRRYPWQSYRLEDGAGGNPRTFELTIRPAFSPQGSTPIEVRRLRFVGDSAIETRTRGDSTTRRQRYAGSVAVPLLYPSLALLEVATRRARRMADTAPRISFLEVDQGERQLQGTLTWLGTDSARVALGGIEFRLAVEADGRVRGGYVPSLQLTIRREDGWVELSAPDYTAPAGASYSAEAVRIVTPGDHWLAATLTRPTSSSGPVPVAITIPGTGQLDRDGTADGLGGYQPFREMAEALAARGIAVLRYDKRGIGGSSPGVGRTTEALAEDVRAMLRFLRGRSDIAADRIALIGHSEGGVIAPMVAASDPQGVRSVVLLAAPAWTGRAVILSQLRSGLAANPSLSDSQRDSVAAVRLARLDASATAGSWMRFYLDYDPLPTARKVRVPVLILQGQTDDNVTPEQASLLAGAMREAGNTRVTVRMLPNVNHMLVDDADGRGRRWLNLPSRQINAEALRLLSDWVADQLRK
jgi:alpha-beta hydrolase superfamily lysophospholipase